MINRESETEIAMSFDKDYLLDAFGINILSSFAFAAISGVIVYSKGQTFFESLSFGVLIGFVIFILIPKLPRRNDKTNGCNLDGIKNDNSQKVNATIISNSQVTKIDNMKLIKK